HKTLLAGGRQPHSGTQPIGGAIFRQRTRRRGGGGGAFQLNKYAYKTCIYTVVKMGFYYFLIK
ncbi:hypothetical protein ACUNFA_12205, partial [Serratia sp. IR-2025]